jgi:hypothetical protein
MLVVDAYNVLHVTGVLPPELAGLEVQELAELVAGSRWGRHQVALVCDGVRPKPPAARGGVERRAPPVADRLPSGIGVHYAGPGASADALIARMVEESSHPRRLTIVSNDRAVQRSATRRRASILTADKWLHQLAADHARAPAKGRTKVRRDPGPLSPAQVDAWLRYFGVEP